MDMTQTQNTNEMAWVTFMSDNWQRTWHPLELNGRQLRFDEEFSFEVAMHLFPNESWGVARTSQMVLNNAERDNL